MPNFLQTLREQVLGSIGRQDSGGTPAPGADKIALGVLLWEVAHADRRFLPEEQRQMEDILRRDGAISEDDLPAVLASVEIASRERIDLFQFTRDVTQDLPYPARVDLMRMLFRVACSDGELAHEEQESIRKIAGLCGIDHEDFIKAKFDVMAEFGLTT